MKAGSALPKIGEPVRHEKNGYVYVRVKGGQTEYRSAKKMSAKSFDYLVKAKVINFILTPDGLADRIKRGNFRG